MDLAGGASEYLGHGAQNAALMPGSKCGRCRRAFRSGKPCGGDSHRVAGLHSLREVEVVGCGLVVEAVRRVHDDEAGDELGMTDGQHRGDYRSHGVADDRGLRQFQGDGEPRDVTREVGRGKS